VVRLRRQPPVQETSLSLYTSSSLSLFGLAT